MHSQFSVRNLVNVTRSLTLCENSKVNALPSWFFRVFWFLLSRKDYSESVMSKGKDPTVISIIRAVGKGGGYLGSASAP